MATTGDIRKDTGRTIFGWIKARCPTGHYAALTRVVVETDQRQLPRSHAEKYELKTIWYWYPLYCLGGISFVAFVILTITGILLGFFYVPDGRLEISPAGDLTNPAWNSMLVIMNEIPFGFIVGGVHHWAAHIMIAAVFLHMCRVYFTGANNKPRELHSGVGIVHMLATFLFSCSGLWNIERSVNPG